MNSTNVLSNSLSNSLSKVIGHLMATGPIARRRTCDQRTEIEARFTRFVARHPELDGSLFDLHFMRSAGSALVAQFVTGKLSRSQAASALAAAWDRRVGPAPTEVRARRIAAMTATAGEFLASLLSAPVYQTQPDDAAVMVRTTGPAGEPILAATNALNAACCDEIVQEAAALYAGGATCITIDLSDVRDVSVCGIYALHAIAAIFGHAACPDAFSSKATSLQALRALAEANLAGGRVDGIRIICPDAALVAELRRVGIDQVYGLAHGDVK